MFYCYGDGRSSDCNSISLFFTLIILFHFATWPVKICNYCWDWYFVLTYLLTEFFFLKFTLSSQRLFFFETTQSHMFFLLVWVISGIEALASKLSCPLMLLKPFCITSIHFRFPFLVMKHLQILLVFLYFGVDKLDFRCLGPVLKENIPMAIVVCTSTLPAHFILVL